MNGQAVCSCLPSFVGVPPRCRPECVSNSECPQDQACVNQRCQDPCPGTCGLQAKCYVNNHNPICTCPPSYTGNPFFRCYPDLPRKSFCLLRYFVVLKDYPYIESLFLFSSCFWSVTTTSSSVYTFTVWSKFCMSGQEWRSCVLVPTWIQRTASILSTRMY